MERERPGRRHAVPEGWTTPGRAGAARTGLLHRPPLEDQPDGEEILERRRWAVRVFIRVMLQPGEHPRPTGKGKGRGQQEWAPLRLP